MPDKTTPEFTGPDICALEAHEVVHLLKKGEVSPAELLDASYERINAVEPAINAMPTLCQERAIAALDELNSDNSDHPGSLAGLPIGVKDLTVVKGVRTTFGTKGLADFIPEASDPLVERMEQRGGVVVGKTNTPEFGAGGNTFNDVFGPTRNPWNTTMNAAGSSGGAAASLATGETWLSHGSDHGGSLRTPAAFCGIVGLRPSPGRAGGHGESGFMVEGAQGPMARSVRDCALFLDTMAGFEPRYPISYPAPEVSFQDAVIKADQKVRISYSPDLNGLSEVEPEITAKIQQALTQVEKNGGKVEEATPDLTTLERTYHVLRGMLWATIDRKMPPEVTQYYKDTLAENTAFGLALTMDDVVDAQLNRTILFDNMRQHLEDFDVLACPTVGCMPRPVEVEWVDQINGVKLTNYMDWLRFAFLATTTGLPAISVPIGLSESGMPIGLQLIGPPRGEAKLL
ncbi:MAG: amidase, partial [Pikeienuella sp.]